MKEIGRIERLHPPSRDDEERRRLEREQLNVPTEDVLRALGVDPGDIGRAVRASARPCALEPEKPYGPLQ